MLRKEKFSDKADILTEAIPYFLKFKNKIFVLKIGGRILDEEEVFDVVAEDIVLLSLVGIKVVVVHGGGKEITRFLERLNIKSHFKDGIRETDDTVMEIVEMVLDGKVNGRFVSAICKKGGKAIGLSGRDNFFLISEQVKNRVGSVVSVKSKDIMDLLSMDFIPVFSSVTITKNGVSMNTNADEVACEIAMALSAEKLIILTDEDGILDKDRKLIKSITDLEAQKLIADGIITGGMIPKVRLALKAVKSGVKKVHIISGLIEHSILLEIFTDEGIGTEIIA